MTGKITISNNQLVLNLCVFILITHAVIVLDGFEWIAIISSALRYLVFLYLALRYMNRPMANRMDALWAVFFVMLTADTVMGHGKLAHVIGSGIDIAGLLMLFHLYKEDMLDLLKAITFSLSFYIYLNFYFMHLYPGGLWTDPISGNGYFLLSGNYNGMGARFLCALTTNLLIINTSRAAKINFIALIIVSLICVLMVRSMTSTVSLLMLFGLWIMASLRGHKKLVIAFFIAYLLIQFFVVFTLSDLSKYTYVVDFVENVLHKNLTFTSRTFLWERSAKLIEASPWFGYGFQDKVWNAIHMHGPGAHNFVYTVLLYGGYPLLLLFIGVIVSALRQNIGYGNQRSLSRLLLAVNTLFFMMIFDYYVFFLIAYLIILIYYYPVIAESVEKSLTKDNE